MSLDYLPKSLYIFYFDIRADFAHFRDIFTHSFFRTYLAPPRTTILGIIGASMGFNEEDTIQLSGSLYTGTKILSINGIAKEIVNVENQKEIGLKTPTMRTLIVNPIYRLYIGGEDKALIERIRDSLLKPVYPLYLGITEFLANIKDISNIYDCEKYDTKFSSCIIPALKYTSKILDKTKFMLLPEINKTVYSFKYTSKGREPLKYIDLVMSYNCKLELNESIPSYIINDDYICMI